jgi:predicted lipoprotein with Yx(FWY)xxD motif/uncharacterized cupredoxin-like copper-binding protein
MKRLILLAMFALLAATSQGAFAQGTPEAEPPPSVFVRQDPALGTILTAPNGMTLYLFTADTVEGESSCYDQCATNWPPFTATEPLALPGGVDGELTTITRTDGTTQVAYNGIPLYLFIKDTQPGDTTGQGAGDKWYVLHPGQQFGATASPVAETSTAPVATPSAENEVTVSLTEFTIAASQTEFKVGETYTFVVQNIGQFPHEMVIEPAGAHDAPFEADGKESVIEPIDAGTDGTISWTFTEPGTYQLACHVRSHYPMGMAVTIHVTE